MTKLPTLKLVLESDFDVILTHHLLEGLWAIGAVKSRHSSLSVYGN
jgi:hypothetical protein